MRKIASNYILLPGWPLIKNGYIVLDEGCVVNVVDTGGVIREIQGLEFYGGMIVSGNFISCIPDCPVGGNMVEWITEWYAKTQFHGEGVVLIKGADLRQLLFTKNMTVERLA